MYDLTLLGTAVVALLLVAGALIYIWQGKKRQKSQTYQWKPDQDYDVVQEGESSMTPAFPKLVKRTKK